MTIIISYNLTRTLLLELLHWKYLADVKIAIIVVFDVQSHKNIGSIPSKCEVFLTEDINIFMGQTDLRAPSLDS